VSRTNKILIAVVAAGLAVCAFYFLALGPQRKQITDLDADITAKQAEIAQAQTTLADYETARKSYKANYATLARLGKAVPADDDVRSLLVQLESTADGTGVDFQKIELGTALAGADGAAGTPTPAGAEGELASAPGAVPVAGGALSAMPFSFTFTGGFFDLSTFFARLEHFVTVNNQRISATGRLLRLESVAISPASTGFPAMQAEIGAATYIVPPVQGVQGAAPATAQNASTPTTPSTPSSPGTTPPTTTATAGAAQ
jgi:Tfp pilus assembly protein PilO